jgi:hypothetical protein
MRTVWLHFSLFLFLKIFIILYASVFDLKYHFLKFVILKLNILHFIQLLLILCKIDILLIIIMVLSRHRLNEAINLMIVLLSLSAVLMDDITYSWLTILIRTFLITFNNIRVISLRLMNSNILILLVSITCIAFYLLMRFLCSQWFYKFLLCSYNVSSHIFFYAIYRDWLNKFWF